MFQQISIKNVIHFKNRQIGDKLLTFAINCIDARAKWKQLIQIIIIIIKRSMSLG